MANQQPENIKDVDVNDEEIRKANGWGDCRANRDNGYRRRNLLVNENDMLDF